MRQGGTAARPVRGPAVVPSLDSWGLSADAGLAYRALVQLGPATAQQLARHLGMRAARISPALAELAALGVAREPRRRGLWRAVDAAEAPALDRPREPLWIGELHRRHLAAVASLHLDRVPPAAVHRLSTRAAARHRIGQLVAGERHEHLAINTEDVITPDAHAAARPLDRSLLARGVRMRILGLTPAPGGPQAGPPGSELRVAPSVPLKLMVFDRKSALFPADPVDFDAGAIEITDPDTVAGLTKLFYDHWRAAGAAHHPEVPPVMLTLREQAIVALLTAGVSEEAAAAELGLSRRTVVYTLRALMDRLGVDNRFQLALILGAARAVPLPDVRQPVPTTPQEQP
ncbi:MAG TPA: LuxR C-terminal-related transcriptional regulator [Pilimelia sp.]|nr:LuxR C-terminal-related transcriptional regulator [Pilimelia sp.]